MRLNDPRIAVVTQFEDALFLNGCAEGLIHVDYRQPAETSGNGHHAIVVTGFMPVLCGLDAAHAQVLHFQVFLDTVFRAFATEAGLLDAAKGADFI